jgi:hypothetical protein
MLSSDRLVNLMHDGLGTGLKLLILLCHYKGMFSSFLIRGCRVFTPGNENCCRGEHSRFLDPAFTCSMGANLSTA